MIDFKKQTKKIEVTVFESLPSVKPVKIPKYELKTLKAYALSPSRSPASSLSGSMVGGMMGSERPAGGLGATHSV